MPDLKFKLDTLLSHAADCQMLGSLSADTETRTQYLGRAEQFRTLADQVRKQIAARPRIDFEFLFEQAARCRGLAAGVDDDAMKADLMTLAEELEQSAKTGRGD